jgi:hypothetical protein
MTTLTQGFRKRHYEAIAAIFKVERPADNWDASKRMQHNCLLCNFVALFHADNPRFDAARFVEACGGYANDC